MSVNNVTIIGHLTKDVELRQTKDGTAVAQFIVAVNRDYGDDKTDFFPIIAWRGQAESCAKYLSKGSQVCVIGRLQTRSYDTQDGAKRTVTEIISTHVEFLSKKEGEKKVTSVEQLKIVDKEELPF